MDTSKENTEMVEFHDLQVSYCSNFTMYYLKIINIQIGVFVASTLDTERDSGFAMYFSSIMRF